MVTNEERKRVAAKLREEAGRHLFAGDYVEEILWGDAYSGFNIDAAAKTYNRLADLIDPDSGHYAGKSSDPTEQGSESIKEWCLGAMEGADGSLDSMLCEIVGAIEDYQHPERIEYVSFEDIGCANCDSLLKLADDTTQPGQPGQPGAARKRR